MTKKPFHGMSDDFDELVAWPADEEIYRTSPQASKPREWKQLKAQAEKLAEALEELCNDQDVPFGIREFAHSALTNWRRYLEGK